MSYVRFAWGGSDVYVYEGRSGIECCGCRLAKKGESWFVTSEPEQMILHLAQHRRAGDYVPNHAIEALWEDIPGAQRPREQPPKEIVRAELMLTVAQLQNRIEDLENPKEKGNG